MPSNSCKVDESPVGEATNKERRVSSELEKVESGKDGKWAIIQSMIKQVRNGTPIYRVHLPIFLQEPRSLLERYADFCSHMDIFTRYECQSTKITSHTSTSFTTSQIPPIYSLLVLVWLIQKTQSKGFYQ